MKEIRFALVGCGFIGKTHAQVISETANARLTAVCDVSEESGRALAEAYGCRYYPDYRQALCDDEVDAVTICLPSGMHSAVAVEAAKAGKHVMCEKPIDVEVERAEAMVNAARENGVQLGVIMQHRFDPPMQLLKRAIADGRLGAPLWGAARTIWYRNDAYFANPWRGTWKYDGGGALINQSIHYIDLLLNVFGDVHSLSAKCRKLRHKQIETEDVGVANLEFANGCIGTIEGTTTAYPGLYAELSVFCEKGSVVIRNDELLFYKLAQGPDPEFEAMLNPEKANILNESPAIDDASHRKQYADFVEALTEGRAPLVTGEDGLKCLRVIKSIYTASQDRREVYL